jgi:hypothetical protein
VKSKLNPKAKPFTLNANAKEFVPYAAMGGIQPTNMMQAQGFMPNPYTGYTQALSPSLGSVAAPQGVYGQQFVNPMPFGMLNNIPRVMLPGQQWVSAAPYMPMHGLGAAVQTPNPMMQSPDMQQAIFRLQEPYHHNG